MKLKLLQILFSVFFISASAIAQSDTLKQTETLIKKGSLTTAYHLMQQYSKNHADDYNAVWLTAKLAYWNKKIKSSKELYRKAINLNNTNFLLKLDYAKMLFDLGEYDNSIQLLKEYTAYDKTSEEAWYYLAKANFYNGNIKATDSIMLSVPANMKQQPLLTALKSEINEYKAFNVNISAAYIDDNQPMQTVSPKINIGKQHNNYLNWYAEAALNMFSNDSLKSSSTIIRAGNKFYFNKLKLTADVSAGFNSLDTSSETSFIGGITLTKKITDAFALSAEVSQNPYYYSLGSTQQMVTQSNLGAAFIINNFKGITGKAQYQQQSFNDDKKINTFSGWILSPAIGSKIFNGKIGYAYEYANADADNFVSVKSLPQIIQDYNNTKFIDGIYHPYFTPKELKSHSALVWLEWKPSEKFDLNFTGNIALKAEMQNPYFYLTTDNTSQTVIEKAYTTQGYTPQNYRAKATYHFNKNFRLSFNYEYFKTAFYTANSFMLNVGFRLINEK